MNQALYAHMNNKRKRKKKKVCQFQLATSFSKVIECVVLFPGLQLGHPTPTQAVSVQDSTPHPPGEWTYQVHLVGHSFVLEGCNLPTSCAGPCGSFAEQMMWHSHLVKLQFHLVESGSALHGGKNSPRFCVYEL
jgi:hypothetical protein